jgi:hypothetical protein
VGSKRFGGWGRLEERERVEEGIPGEAEEAGSTD